LGLSVGLPARHETAAGVARFELWLAEALVCPLGWVGNGSHLHVCAAGGWGFLSARGSQTLEPREHRRPWGMLGGALWGSVRLGEGFALSADAGAGANLVRDSFQFQPEVFYTAGPWAVRAAGALSLELD
jgi:hypothetical protein